MRRKGKHRSKLEEENLQRKHGGVTTRREIEGWTLRRQESACRRAVSCHVGKCENAKTSAHAYTRDTWPGNVGCMNRPFDEGQRALGIRHDALRPTADKNLLTGKTVALTLASRRQHGSCSSAPRRAVHFFNSASNRLCGPGTQGGAPFRFHTLVPLVMCPNPRHSFFSFFSFPFLSFAGAVRAGPGHQLQPLLDLAQRRCRHLHRSRRPQLHRLDRHRVHICAPWSVTTGPTNKQTTK